MSSSPNYFEYGTRSNHYAHSTDSHQCTPPDCRSDNLLPLAPLVHSSPSLLSPSSTNSNFFQICHRDNLCDICSPCNQNSLSLNRSHTPLGCGTNSSHNPAFHSHHNIAHHSWRCNALCTQSPLHSSPNFGLLCTSSSCSHVSHKCLDTRIPNNLSPCLVSSNVVFLCHLPCVLCTGRMKTECRKAGSPQCTLPRGGSRMSAQRLAMVRSRGRG